MPCFGMKYYLAIFALLVGFDATGKFSIASVQVSPANPVQFWPVDCQTFNQKYVCGIFHRCWDSPWQCDDEITNQFYEVFTGNSGQGNLNLESFQNNPGSGADWITGSNPSVQLLVPGTSDWLYLDFDFIAGLSYTITTDLDSTLVVAGGFLAAILDSSFNILESSSTDLAGGGNKTNVLSFIAQSNTKIAFRSSGLESTVDVNSSVVDLVPDEYTLQILDENGNEIDQLELSITVIDGTYETVVAYSNTFIPSDLNICDDRISLKLLKLTGSPDDEILLSDPLDIKTEQPCTNLIEYWHNRNYAGLIYDGLSPSITFKIRIKSVFYDEELPQEDFVMELPQGVEKTGSVLTSQRLMKIHKVPEYQHKKLVLVFSHQFVLIDSSYWTKAEKYEKTAKSNERQPMRNAQILLTQRDFLVRSNL